MARYSKFIVAAIAAAGVIASSGALDGPAQTWLNIGIAVASAVLVLLVPNAELPPRPPTPPK